VVGDVVVSQSPGHAGTESGGDVVRSAGYRLARRPTVPNTDNVGSQEVAACAGQRIRITVAIGLAVGVGGPGSVAGIDGKAIAVVGDVVVSQSPGHAGR